MLLEKQRSDTLIYMNKIRISHAENDFFRKSLAEEIELAKNDATIQHLGCVEAGLEKYAFSLVCREPYAKLSYFTAYKIRQLGRVIRFSLEKMRGEKYEVYDLSMMAHVLDLLFAIYIEDHDGALWLFQKMENVIYEFDIIYNVPLYHYVKDVFTLYSKGKAELESTRFFRKILYEDKQDNQALTELLDFHIACASEDGKLFKYYRKQFPGQRLYDFLLAGYDYLPISVLVLDRVKAKPINFESIHHPLCERAGFKEWSSDWKEKVEDKLFLEAYKLTNGIFEKYLDSPHRFYEKIEI